LPGFDDIYSEHFKFVWTALRRLGVDREGLDDACQEVFLVVHRRLGDFEARSSVRTWLFGIARKVAADWRRRNRRHQGCDELPALAATPEANPYEIACTAQRFDLLQRVLDAMDERKREVFVLSELAGLSGPEMARALDIRLETAYARIRAARQEFDRIARRLSNLESWRLALGEDEEPSEDDQRRVRQLLVPLLPLGGATGLPDSVSDQSATGLGFGAGKTAALIALATAGWLALSQFAPHSSLRPKPLALGVDHLATARARVPDPLEPAAMAPNTPIPAAAPLPRSALRPAAARSPEPALEEAASPSSPEPTKEKPQVTETADAATVADETSTAPAQEDSNRSALRLGAELRLLRRARAALRSGDPGKLAVALKRYDAEFPGGQMRRERAALGIVELCLRGRERAARARARTFAKRYSDQALATTVRRFCPTL
jgi:RNA polymerase sigma-70 factor (ECF subfamily)